MPKPEHTGLGAFVEMPKDFNVADWLSQFPRDKRFNMLVSLKQGAAFLAEHKDTFTLDDVQHEYQEGLESENEMTPSTLFALESVAMQQKEASFSPIQLFLQQLEIEGKK